MSSLGESLIDKRTSYHFSSVSHAHKVRELQNRLVGTRNTKVSVDHVSDLSFSKKSVIPLGVLLLQVDTCLEVRVQQDLRGRCDPGVQGYCFPVIVRRSQVVNVLSCFDFSAPRHWIRGVIRNRTNFCSKNQLPMVETLTVWDITRILICPFL